MSRLAVEHGAVNLSQGFPNEPPPLLLRLQVAYAALTGHAFVVDPSLTAAAAAAAAADGGASTTASSSVASAEERSLRESLLRRLVQEPGDDEDETEKEEEGDDYAGASKKKTTIEEAAPTDILNQYSPPMGRPDVRHAIATYYQRFYQYNVSPDHMTVTLGATEAVAAALRSIGRPGDRCVIFEPFHELYPSQCHIFYLQPVFVTLRYHNYNGDGGGDAAGGGGSATTTTGDRCSRGGWTYDRHELRTALSQARVLLLNSPHNPTGKVFTKMELVEIVEWCLEYDVYIITDEIYEHMCYNKDNDSNDNGDDDGDDGDDEHDNGKKNKNNNQNRHIFIPQEFPAMADRTFVCNSIGKSASATGWRVGWCLHPPSFTETYRGIHDQLAVMSPHPMQYATVSYLTILPDAYFASLARRYRARVAMMVAVLQDLGFGIAMPQGAYYLFADYRSVPALAHYQSAMAAAMFLLTEVGVACVPGDNFYGQSTTREKDGERYLRFAACRSVADLMEASRRLARLKTMPTVAAVPGGLE
jgi:aspartate/methionine/tyrosine aminotransferase